MTLPGGPALLNHGPADLSEVFIFSRATRFLIEAHHISHVVLLAHQGCGFYRARCGRASDEQIQKMQIAHLEQAARSLVRQHPELKVASYYMRVLDGQIAFDDLAHLPVAAGQRPAPPKRAQP
jgi:hypothetical protein